MTTVAMPLVRPRNGTVVILAVGVTLGLAYSLSPLSVLSLAVLAAAAWLAGRDLVGGERRWFWCLVVPAVLARALAIAALFYFADPAHPFASFFGDEDLYKFRTVWLRNLGQGIPISPADVIYTYDDVGRSGHMFTLAFVQALVGDAPYGLHMMSMTLYFCGVLLLFRVARASYGPVVSMAGFAALLFLPTLGLWSITVLKEPMNVLVLALELVCAVGIVRAPRWWQKGLAIAAVIFLAVAMEAMRGGGQITAIAGTLGGVALITVLASGRRLLAALIAAPIAVAVLLSLPPVQERVLAQLRLGAHYHSGHILTPGYGYRILNPNYYPNRIMLLNSMPADDAGRFAAYAVWSYFAEPLPWKTDSTALMAYLPEQFIWYGMVLMTPFGLLAGLRRDRVMTAMLASHAAFAIVVVALTSGNLGTLIRHRSLVMFYLVWLSALGVHECVRVVTAAGRRPEEQERV